jgi:hypothetical protein
VECHTNACHNVQYNETITFSLDTRIWYTVFYGVFGFHVRLIAFNTHKLKSVSGVLQRAYIEVTRILINSRPSLPV